MPRQPLLLLLFWLSGTAGAMASEAVVPVAAHAEPAYISIIIDDLGNRKRDGLRAVNLPGQLTYAILPHLPFSSLLAERAHALNKEIMLHMPMEAHNGKAMGPGGLSQCMQEQQFKRMVHRNFAAVPHARGFNNHMGSLLTESPTLMRWVMQAAMFRGDIYFVDSRTSSHSVAMQNASQRGIESTQRDIFLDYEQDSEIVQQQLARLVQRAQQRGTALAIGHPYPETLQVLEQWLPTLAELNIRLVPVSELINLRQPRRSQPWPMYSSR